jgi:hypothetical protein
MPERCREAKWSAARRAVGEIYRAVLGRQEQAHDGEAMNTIARVTLIAVIMAFLVLLVWGLWLQ